LGISVNIFVDFFWKNGVQYRTGRLHFQNYFTQAYGSRSIIIRLFGTPLANETQSRLHCRLHSKNSHPNQDWPVLLLQPEFFLDIPLIQCKIAEQILTSKNGKYVYKIIGLKSVHPGRSIAMGMSIDVEIRGKIKQIITNTTSIPTSEIADTAAYKEDLGLDSLTILEITVDVDHEFDLELPEEELAELRTVQDSVELVQKYLQKAAQV
jgi:acyl carrier protein